MSVRMYQTGHKPSSDARPPQHPRRDASNTVVCTCSPSSSNGNNTARYSYGTRRSSHAAAWATPDTAWRARAGCAGEHAGHCVTQRDTTGLGGQAGQRADSAPTARGAKPRPLPTGYSSESPPCPRIRELLTRSTCSAPAGVCRGRREGIVGGCAAGGTA